MSTDEIDMLPIARTIGALGDFTVRKAYLC